MSKLAALAGLRSEKSLVENVEWDPVGPHRGTAGTGARRAEPEALQWSGRRWEDQGVLQAPTRDPEAEPTSLGVARRGSTPAVAWAPQSGNLHRTRHPDRADGLLRGT